ncbi:hypothetical protein ACJMK2_022925 [Sinanodonta woodiana]|uniref:Uncharacterized protein n=1 Tax=Sinanodonta woodiana TaxID=1069815 RepID=A0ABD3TML0_SINWO
MDNSISLTEVAISGEKAKRYGACDTIMHIIEDPTDGGNYVDLIGATAFDRMTRHIAGNTKGKKIEYNCDKRKLEKAFGEENATMTVDLGEKTMQKERLSMDIINRCAKVTDVMPVLDRPVTTCAEQQAYNKFSPAMGDVPTDLIPETPVPQRVRFRKAAQVTALGVGVQALSVKVESTDM